MLTFKSFEAYEEYANTHPGTFMYKPVCLIEHGVIRMDCTYKCKSYKTAIRRFFKDFASVEKLDGWIDYVFYMCNEERKFDFVDWYTYGESWAESFHINEVDNGEWYVNVNFNLNPPA